MIVKCTFQLSSFFFLKIPLYQQPKSVAYFQAHHFFIDKNFACNFCAVFLAFFPLA